MTLRTVVLQADFTGCPRGGCRETVQSGTELGSAAPGQEAVGLSAGRTGPNCPDRATQHYASAHWVPCVCPGDLGLEKDSRTVVQPFRSHLKRHPQEKKASPGKKGIPREQQLQEELKWPGNREQKGGEATCALRARLLLCPLWTASPEG